MYGWCRYTPLFGQVDVGLMNERLEEHASCGRWGFVRLARMPVSP